jgi:bacterial/archaeal transporter family protein
MHFWFWMSTVALILFGITGVTQKLSTNRISFELSFVWFSAAFLLLALIIGITVSLDWRLTPGLVALAALGGLLNGLGGLTSFAALEKGGKASVVIPIVNLYPLVTIAGAWIFLGERLTLTQGAGIVFALVAVILLSQEAVASS